MADKTVTVRPSGGTYTSLAAAITGEVTANANLVTMSGILNISIEGDWSGAADSTGVNVTGFTVNSSYYVKIITDSANKAGTVWSESKYRLAVSGSFANVLTLTNDYTVVDGLQVRNTHTDGLDTIRENGNYCKALNCLVANCGHNSTAYYDFHFRQTTSILINCVSLNSEGGGIYAAGIASNCTVMHAGGVGTMVGTIGNLTGKNLVSAGNVGADYARVGSPVLTNTTCFSEDASLSTSTIEYSTSTFANVTAASENAALVAGSALIGAGTDLRADAGYAFDYDIIGTARGATWDVGAFEYVAPAGGLSIPVAMHHYRMLRG
jgi:hypothetical protein